MNSPENYFKRNDAGIIAAWQKEKEYHQMTNIQLQTDDNIADKIDRNNDVIIVQPDDLNETTTTEREYNYCKVRNNNDCI